MRLANCAVQGNGTPAFVCLCGLCFFFYSTIRREGGTRCWYTSGQGRTEKERGRGKKIRKLKSKKEKTQKYLPHPLRCKGKVRARRSEGELRTWKCREG